MLAIVLALWLAIPAHAETVDRIVVVVEDQIVLASDIELDLELSEIDPSPLPFWSRPRHRPEHRAVEAALIRHLAADTPFYQPEDRAVRARREALRARFADREAWLGFLGRWGLDEASLSAVLRRRMIVERYLSRNIAVDPADEPAWWKACLTLLAEAEDRVDIREIEPERAP